MSEEMLLGLGEGVGFGCRMGKGMQALLLNMRGAGVLELEENICKKLGIKMRVAKTKGKKEAEKDLMKMLEKGEPAVVYVDVRRLPYVPAGRVCHLGAHAVVVAEIDVAGRTALLADTDAAFHRVPLATLADARYSACSPSPHDSTMLKFTYPKTLSPIASAIESAAVGAAHNMLNSRDENSGVRGIRLLARGVASWPDQLGSKHVSQALRTAALLIEESGTGGGGFRKMYGRFLGEASRMLKDPEVAAHAAAVTGLARKWSTLAAKMKSAKVTASELSSLQRKISGIADSEEAVWKRQRSIFE